MTTHTCRWIHLPAMQGRPALYCKRPVGHRYVVEPDGTRRREYYTFCEEHQAKVDAQAKTGEEDGDDHDA